MEFKSLEKWRVQKNFSLTEEQLDLAIKRMIKRHPSEYWVINRIAKMEKKFVILNLNLLIG